MVGLSYGMLQNLLAFRDSPIVPLRHSFAFCSQRVEILLPICLNEYDASDGETTASP